ncbi:MAG: ribosome rescue protein RqcH [Methanoculleaceae archaeon]
MATEQGMSGIDLRAMTMELRSELPLWIGKFYQYGPKTIGIRLNKERRERLNLFVEAGRRAHLVKQLPPAPVTPSSFAMYLRKHLSGGRVLGIFQYGLERIFWLDIGKGDGVHHLLFELFGEGNVVICSEDWVIEKPLWHHRYREREVVPGAVYRFLGKFDDLPDRISLGEILETSGRDLVRTLAVNLMLGGQYAEEICRMAGIDRHTPAREADAGAVHDALIRLVETAERRPEPVITDKGCLPYLPPGSEAKERFQSFNEALAAYFGVDEGDEKITAESTSGESATLSREEYIRQQQYQAIRRFEDEIRRLESIVEKIYGNYTIIDDIIRTLSRARESRSWEEIRQILQTSDHPSSKLIRAVHPAEGAVDLDLGLSIRIYIDESVEANAGRYYDRIKKLKKKLEGARKAVERPLVERKEKQRQRSTGRPRWYHRFRWFFTSDGTLVVGGRDASQNEELVKRYMEGKDTFMHADVHGGAVVIVKGETSCLEEAAVFAASYSNAWRSGHLTADVYAVHPSQVSKTPPSGEYLSRGAFIVRGERRYFRDVPLGIAVGIRTEPSPALIAGPPAVVESRCPVSVGLQPGRFEPHDIARKVVRALERRLGEREARSLKSVLNTDAVVRLMPPGGSDLVDEHEG